TNVKRSLSIAQEDDGSLTERRIRRLFRIGRSEAGQALQPYGYYNPKIAAALQPPTDADQGVWHASYTIKTGPPTTVEQLTLDLTGPGQDYPALRQVLENSQLHEGDTLH